jgi:DNA-binding Lrp family transcriptional regulator
MYKSTNSTTRPSSFSTIEKKLLNNYQHDFPLTTTPFADIAQQLGTDEETVLAYLQALKETGIVSRVGAVFRVNRIGVSTLAAIAVPEVELATIANIVSGFSEVNHNYEREHRFNLWFVLNAVTHDELQQAIARIEKETGYAVMQLPMLNDFYIDLGFKLQWT